MAITDSQKVDYLLKKIGYGVAKTDTLTSKSPANESIASPLLLRGENIWQQSGTISSVSVLPTANTSVVSIYRDTLSSTIQTTNDGTAATNRTWKTNLTDWIGPEFGSGYAVKVYTGASGNASPQSLTALPSDGSGNNDSWYFDYQSGVLNFADTNVPTAVTGNVIYISGARYTGQKGISNFPGGLTMGNITINGNAVTSSSGNLYVGNSLIVFNIGDVSANIGALYSNATTQQTSIDSINANLGAFEIYANANIGTLYLGNISTNANLGAYQIYANANIGAITTSLQTLNANIGAFEIYANANIGTLYLGNISTNANLGAYEVWANANLSTQTTNFNTLNANVGAYEVWANANLSTQTTNFNTLNANVGAYEIYANANIGAYQTYANTQIQTVNANLGAYQIYANANAGSQATSLNTINANLGAYQIYANANIGGVVTSVSTLNANVGAYETWANANIGGVVTSVSTLNANVGAYQVYANANAATQQTQINSLSANANVVTAAFLLAGVNAVTITGPYNYTGANTSALVVYAGAEIGANLYVGGNLIVQGNTYELQTEIINQSVVVASSISAGAYFYANGTPLNYGNVQVAAYLPTYTGSLAGSSDIVALYSNAATQQTSINTINANIGAYETWANLAISATNSNVTAANLAISTLQQSMYANANVAGYLPTYSGTIGNANISLNQRVTSNSTNATFYPSFYSVTNGNSSAYTNAALNFNPSTGVLYANTFSGNVSANNLTVSNTSTFSGNISVNGYSIFNPLQITGLSTIVKGTYDSTLLWAIPGSSYDQVLIGGSATNATLVAGAKLQINSTDSILLPRGDNLTRPASPAAGMLRYNTVTNGIEWFNGNTNQWDSSGGNNNTTNVLITDQQFAGNGVATNFTLTNPSSSAGLVVSINGILQIPTVSYSVSTDGYTLTFTEAPSNNDLIDVRVMSAATTVTGISSDNGQNTLYTTANGVVVNTGGHATVTWNTNGAEVNTNPAIAVTNSGTLTTLDTFDSTLYSSAEYTVTGTIQGTSIRQIATILVITNGVNAYLTTYGVVSTAGNTLAIFSGNVVSANVNLGVTTTNNNMTFRVRKNYQQL